ncbi:MAG: hypothetical protein NTW69_06325 [Chloroflexi bacterium]|nr:hypothetical protein [Chloroflexota bacterium]
MPYLKKAMTLSVRAVQERVAEYPPSTEANQPGRISIKTHKPMGYYERGRGWWYPIMTRATLGEKIGKSVGAIKTSKNIRVATNVAGYKLADGGLSEMLGRSWDAQTIEIEGAILGVVGNNTSYAEYVQGDKQWRGHKARGWLTVDQALEMSQDDINKFFEEATDEFIKTELAK